MALPIPKELLEHPAINEHPHIRELHQTYGGIPEDAHPAVVDCALGFANAVASHAVEPGTKSRRTDPSPRRCARVWRSEILGHREPHLSTEQSFDTDAAAAAGAAAVAGEAPVNLSMSASHLPSARAKFRSRSRSLHSATTPVVKEEPDDSSGAETPRTPGKRDFPVATTQITQLEHRVSTMVQQQHEFHERLVRRMFAMEKLVEQGQTRDTNKINAYLGRPLLPVTNGRDAIPHDLPPLTSPEVIRSVSRGEVDRWLEYYTGEKGGDTDEKSARQALRACVGVDVQLM